MLACRRRSSLSALPRPEDGPARALTRFLPGLDPATESCGIATVDVIEDVVRGEDPPLAPVPLDVPLLRTAFRGPAAAHPVGEVSRVPDGTPFSRVLADLRPRLVPVERDNLWLPADPARAAAIEQSAAHSLTVAPLALRGRAKGVVSFYRHGTEEHFEEEDIALAADVCAHAALCIDNARRFTRERTIAVAMKRRLLPQRPAVTSAVDFTHPHLPGPGGGGAWFDVIELAGARTALVLGDVAGLGITTTTTMGQLRMSTPPRKFSLTTVATLPCRYVPAVADVGCLVLVSGMDQRILPVDALTPASQVQVLPSVPKAIVPMPWAPSVGDIAQGTVPCSASVAEDAARHTCCRR
ncbi:GAF domain-containing protein [Streptomyces sp. NPDC059629]|uniref:GAF domain-containing protein n=1 Tax=Streptomyces sp. NPDC059629 TaxID=3346889 RepID=UPI0036BC2E9B